VPEKVAAKIKSTHFMLDKFLFENRSVYDIMQKNMLEPDRTQ